MLTQAQTAGQYFTNDQIKEMTRKVSGEVDLVHQQTQNQRYGSSHTGATAQDISNVVTDAASGVVDMFHGIDKAVADTFFFQAEDGIRDVAVTGVQTCALPICGGRTTAGCRSRTGITRSSPRTSITGTRSGAGPAWSRAWSVRTWCTPRPTAWCGQIGRASCRERV